MMQMRQKTILFISGTIWFTIGVWLMYLGVKFLNESFLQANPVLLSSLSLYLGGRDMAVIAIVVTTLLFGALKGKFALGKAARRQIKRVQEGPQQLPIHRLYSPGQYLLIASMIGLGFLIRWFNVPLDIRGAVDLLIGAALVNGSMHYFRELKTAEA